LAYGAQAGGLRFRAAGGRAPRLRGRPASRCCGPSSAAARRLGRPASPARTAASGVPLAGRSRLATGGLALCACLRGHIVVTTPSVSCLSLASPPVNERNLGFRRFRDNLTSWVSAVPHR
jgi:hypothetical protein